MKKYINQAVLLFLCVFLFASCGKEDINEIENTIVYEVTCDTPGAELRINDLTYYNQYFIVKGNWKSGEYVTKSDYVAMRVYCYDLKALVTCKIYVNGKLRDMNEGNGYVVVGCRLK